MIKFLKKLFGLLLVFGLLITAFSTTVSIVAISYYDDVNTSSGQNLIKSLHDIIKNPDVTSYDGLKNAYKQTDINPKTGKIWDMYSNYNYAWTTNMSGGFASEGAGYNREHSIPQSWFNEAYPMKADLFHVYPTDGYVNKKRGNYPFGEVKNAEYISGNGSKLGSSSVSGYSGTVFEPIDEYKGDFARTYFYFITCYYDKSITASEGSVVFKTSYPYLTDYAIRLFNKWHEQDPVSEKETNRNEAVYKIQKNRNPFIDHPEYANTIWGSNYGGGDTPATTYKVTYSVPTGASFSYTDNTAYESGQTIKTPTSNPTKSGYQFDGWYKENTYQTKWNFSTDKITADLTLYAKMNEIKDYKSMFKNSTIETKMAFNYNKTEGDDTGIDSEEIIYSGYANGAELSSYSGENVNITYDAGTNKNTPKWYDAGKAARFYGGNKITFTSDSEIKEIRFTLSYYVNNGEIQGRNGLSTTIGSYEILEGSTTDADNNVIETAVWTGSAKSVTFTVNGTSGHQRIKGYVVSFASSEDSYEFEKGAIYYRYEVSAELKELLEDFDYSFTFLVDGQEVNPSYQNDVYMITIKVDDINEKHTVKGLLICGQEEITTDKVCSYSLKELGQKFINEHKDLLGENLKVFKGLFS